MVSQAVLHSQVFTTPDELRQIADAMEARCRTIAWGENSTVFSWHGPYCLVDVLIDDERITAKRPANAQDEGDEGPS